MTVMLVLNSRNSISRCFTVGIKQFLRRDMSIKIQRVLISDEIDQQCVEILQKNGIEVNKNTKLSKDQLLEEIKVCSIWMISVNLELYFDTFYKEYLTRLSLFWGLILNYTFMFGNFLLFYLTYVTEMIGPNILVWKYGILLLCLYSYLYLCL